MIKNILISIGFILLIIGMIYGSWFLKRTVNYKLCYQDQVQAEIQKQIKPLNDRITALEFQIWMETQ